MNFIRTIFSMLFFLVASAQAWTSILHIEPAKNGSIKKNGWQFEKINIKPFNQLIFSWNAIRPAGYYIFNIRVRDSMTKRWYSWHKAAQWGNGVQRSFSDGHARSGGRQMSTDYNFVRLELPKLKYADGFAVSITTHNASVKDIARLSFNTLNLTDFKHESIYNVGNLPTILINKVPRISQMCIDHEDKVKLCSPTSITILASYLTGKQIDAKQVAQKVYDDGLAIYGSWPFNTAHAYELVQGKFFFHIERLANFTQLHAHLRKGIPVIVSVTGSLKGAPMNYKSGHLLVVIGFDAKRKKVWCSDPAFSDAKSTLVSYDLADFLKAWESSKRLAYIASKKSP